MTGQKRSIASYLNLNNPLEYDSLQDLAAAIRESYANDWGELDDDFYIDNRTVAASKAADAFVTTRSSAVSHMQFSIPPKSNLPTP